LFGRQLTANLCTPAADQSNQYLGIHTLATMMNNQLKLAINWRLNKLPELITKLQKLMESQYVDTDRAILGQGNCTLKPDLVRFRLTMADWQQMSTGQQLKLKDSCFRLPSSSNTATSMDSTLTVTQAAKNQHKESGRLPNG